MTCASCAQVIEDNTKKLSGVDSVVVNFATEKVQINTQEMFSPELFFELMNRLGYRAVDLDQLPELKSEGFFNKQFFQASLSLFAGILLMLLSMNYFPLKLSLRGINFSQLIVAVIVLLFFGKTYLLSVFSFIKNGHSNMNTLIGLGLLAAFLYSVVLMIVAHHPHVYFETIPFILGFTQLGHFFEDKAKTKVRSSLSSLYKMQIKFAMKIIDGKEFNTPVIELKKDDIIRLRPGDKIPLDGRVIEGVSHNDESMITGESQAVAKMKGDDVFAGSLNLEGSLLIQIKNELHQTFISDVVHYVEKAQLHKAPIQKYADKIVRVFVPFILFFAVLTFIAWWLFSGEFFWVDKSYLAFSHMIAVLLIACPCALGLAVPIAVLLSTVEASKVGLLIGGGDAIEKASSIDTVVFDKTGTLTQGHPVVVNYHSLIDEKVFFSFAASASQYSNHPLSQAISKFVAEKNINLFEPDKFKNIPGLGVDCFIEGKQVLLGSASFLNRAAIKISENVEVGSHVYLALDGEYAGGFTIADPIKAESKKTVEQLSLMGIEVWMLSGDNPLVAFSIANELGIIHVKANVLPVEKADFILNLKKNGKVVAMIGDGINDAPALSAADLGIAMSCGSDVAIEASDVSVLDGKIESVEKFFKLSRRTMRIIKQNLFLSFFYNLLCIPLAAGVFVPWASISLTPMWASLAMGLSSLSVILSSLRLKKSI